MQTDFLAAAGSVLSHVWRRLTNGFIQHSWLTILLTMFVSVMMFIPDSASQFSFNYKMVTEQGEWWRLFMSPFVHASWDHYTWNVIVLIASSLVCEQINRKAFVIYFAAIILLNALFKITLYSQQQTALGFSGIASGTFVLLLLLIIGEGVRSDDFWMILITAVILCLFTGHELGFIGNSTGWEVLTGRSIDGGAPGKKVKPAHLLGMATGFVVGGVWLYWFLLRRR